MKSGAYTLSMPLLVKGEGSVYQQIAGSGIVIRRNATKTENVLFIEPIIFNQRIPDPGVGIDRQIR
jgi:hypothetical protein